MSTDHRCPKKLEDGRRCLRLAGHRSGDVLCLMSKIGLPTVELLQRIVRETPGDPSQLAMVADPEMLGRLVGHWDNPPDRAYFYTVLRALRDGDISAANRAMQGQIQRQRGEVASAVMRACAEMTRTVPLEGITALPESSVRPILEHLARAFEAGADGVEQEAGLSSIDRERVQVALSHVRRHMHGDGP